MLDSQKLKSMGRGGFEPPTHGFSALDSAHKPFVYSSLQGFFMHKNEDNK
jgi:hypothetical protein